jgi:hypothetical protein
VARERDRINSVGLMLIISLHAQIFAALANQDRIEPWQRTDSPTATALAQRACKSLFCNEAASTSIGMAAGPMPHHDCPTVLYDFSFFAFSRSGLGTRTLQALTVFQRIVLSPVCYWPMAAID